MFIATLPINNFHSDVLSCSLGERRYGYFIATGCCSIILQPATFVANTHVSSQGRGTGKVI